jgi:hypothetical protein
MSDIYIRHRNLSRERIERLARTVGRSKHLTEGDKQTTEAQDHKTTLGTTGVPYRTEAGEELIAERLRQLSASGRPAERMDVIRELASRGELAVYQDTHDFEEELQRSIPTEKRTPQNAPSEGAGRTLAEGMAIAAAQRAAERHSELRSSTKGDRLVELGEESDYERRIRAWTSQGYPRHDAVWRIELQDQMVAG